MPPQSAPFAARLASTRLRLGLAFCVVLLLSLFVLSRRAGQLSKPSASHPGAVSRFLSLSGGANASIAADLRALTAGPHLAGTAPSAAATGYVLDRLRAKGLRTVTRSYTPLLSYRAHASLALLRPDRSLLAHLSVDEPADAVRRLVPPYHAYSPSGGAVAEAVYVNLGREEDYHALKRLGVGVRGRVAVARRGGGYRGGVVARAAARGATAVLIAGDDAGGVERGTVILGGPGDPLTPGWAATAEAERLGFDDEAVRRRLPPIPSMPVSATTAAAIVRSLGGPAVPAEWRTALGLGEDVCGIGPGPTLVNFTYQEDKKLTTIQDVFAIIRGYEEPDRYVILGNHRDAWTYGAVDPNSGTAALLDIARRLGTMLQTGWTPRRTIILCSWDAEEFGMIGSTEWVEENLGDLYTKTVAYLNVDCAVQGLGFFAGSTPQLDKLLTDVTKQVKDPDVEGKMVYNTWIAMNGGISIERLARADSDFTAFLHHAGIPSVDLYYGKEFSGYHTAHDAYVWMEKLGDPLFLRHLAIAEIWGLLALRLADDPVLPFDYQTYASQLQDHTSALTAMMNGGPSVNMMNGCIHDLGNVAEEVLKEAEKLQQQDILDEFTFLRRRSLNDRLLLAERSFLEPEGLQGRGWFKHLLYSPPEDYGSNASFFPGIADAMSRSRNLGRKKRRQAILHEMWKVARAIQRAVNVLRGELAHTDELFNFTASSAP